MSSLPDSRPPIRRSRLAAIAALAALLALAGVSGVAWALYTGSTTDSGNVQVAAPDWVAPTASSSVVGKTQGGTPGYIHQGGTYNVYANVSDAGQPASGVASVTGDLSLFTASLTSAPLSSGSFTMGPTSYNQRSASGTANATLAEATYSYSLTSRDAANNARTQSGFSVIVDNTAPTAVDIQTTNKTGNVAGTPEIGDTVIYTFSEPIDPYSILANWSGAATNVVVRITNKLGDPLTVFDAANTTQLALGSVDLGRTDYATANATFGATGTASTIVQSGNTVTVTLGTASSGPASAAAPGVMTWSPSSAATDRAANPESAATRDEVSTPPGDKEF